MPKMNAPMTAKDVQVPAKQDVPTPQSDQGLPRVVRHITAYGAHGKSIFQSSEMADNTPEPEYEPVAGDTLHSTRELLPQLRAEVDGKKFLQIKPTVTTNTDIACPIVDFAPGCESPIRLSGNIDYAVIIEGVFKLVLDSGEERIMQRGDVAVLSYALHQWINITGDGLLPGRFMLALCDRKGLVGQERKVNRFSNVRGVDYVDLRSSRADPPPVLWQATQNYDYYESELH